VKWIRKGVAFLLMAAGLVGTAPADEEVSISRGKFDLAATILKPDGPGPFPGIVMLPGSGPHTRAFSRTFAEQFAEAGLAVISYDKRGNGESGGNWVTSSLEDLAADGLAAMQQLAAQPEVDARRIGLWAPSQGAWVASVMHTMTPDIAFLVVMSGGGVTPRTSETYSYHQALERIGASADGTARAEAMLDAYFTWLATGEEREALVEMIEADEDEPWYQALQLGQVLPSDKNRPNWAWVATYDPLPAIETMRFPVLLLFGEDDAQQPTSQATARWAEGLENAGNEHWRIEVFEGADHMIRVGDPAAGHDRPLAPGLLELITGWLRQQTGLDQVVTRQSPPSERCYRC